MLELLDALPLPLALVDERSQVLFATPAAATLGLQRGGRLGAGPPSPPEGASPLLERLLAQARGEGLPAEGEVFDQRSGRWFAVGVYPTGRTSAEGGRLFLCTAWETGEGRRAREERDLWALAVEQATDSIMITDPGARILYVNAAFERLAGVSRDEAIGQTCPLLCSPLPSSSPLPSAAQLSSAAERGAAQRGSFHLTLPPPPKGELLLSGYTRR